ncbi:MAG: hypothetical protein DWQ06_03980 [Calditrichaeota bacterium]|nr:MAG: hypothetical protein DWQ06_03980 [Calditrichota bacterium]
MKSILIISLFISLIGCEIDRDNPLDPKNPDNSFQRINLVELFYKRGDNLSSFATQAFEVLSLDGTYKDQIALIQYDLLPDEISGAQNFYENERANGINFGIPDFFLNGNEGRAQGASSYSNALRNYKETLQEATNGEFRESDFTFWAELQPEGDLLTIQAELGNVSEIRKSNLLLRGVVVENQGGNFKFSAVQLLNSKNIPILEAGEVSKFTFPSVAISNLQNRFEKINVVVWVEENKQVSQAGVFK